MATTTIKLQKKPARLPVLPDGNHKPRLIYRQNITDGKDDDPSWQDVPNITTNFTAAMLAVIKHVMKIATMNTNHVE